MISGASILTLFLVLAGTASTKDLTSLLFLNLSYPLIFPEMEMGVLLGFSSGHLRSALFLFGKERVLFDTNCILYLPAVASIFILLLLL